MLHRSDSPPEASNQGEFSLLTAGNTTAHQLLSRSFLNPAARRQAPKLASISGFFYFHSLFFRSLHTFQVYGEVVPIYQ